MTSSVVASALVRAPFRPLELGESWDASLLKQAAELIGYRPTALAQQESAHKRSLDENILARALERLDIQPFTIQSVEAYKALMLKRAHKGESLALTQYMHRSNRHSGGAGERVVYRLGIPAWIGFVGTSITCAALHFGGWVIEAGPVSPSYTWFMPSGMAGFLMLLPTTGLAAWAFLMFLRHKRAVKIGAFWNNFDVDRGYSKPIPAFAIQRMISLKQELPEVTFSVQELNVTKQEIKTEKYLPPPPPDPFLVATFRGVSCYVDVWDEPAFEGCRTR